MLVSHLSLLAACGITSPAPPAAPDYIDPTAYHGLFDGNSWTWRDDEGDGIPEEEELLRAQLLDEVVVDIRRGIRWADGTPSGRLMWDLSDGLAIANWEIGDSAGDDLRPLVLAQSLWGDTIEEGDWRCDVAGPTSVETYYALYSDVLQITCTGDGPAGIWSFARDRGLVHLALEDGTVLDAVAAW